MAKSLIKFSMYMKNVSTFSKCISTTRFCHSSRGLTEVTGDLKIEEPTTKELFQILKDDSDLSRLIENLEANKTKIDCRHAVVALKTMRTYFEKNEMLTEEVHKNEHFLNMCSILSRHLTSMELTQIIESLKILNFLQVSSSSVIVQSLLQLIRHSVNDLALYQIYYLSYIFKLMKPTPLSSAIDSALPTVFMSQLSLKLDRDDIKALQSALRYASENVISEKTIQYILDALNDNLDPIDPNIAIDILWSLLKIKNKSNSYCEVLYRVQKVILNESAPLQQNKVINVLTYSCKLIIDGDEHYYYPRFLDKLIDYIITDKYNFNAGSYILNLLNKFKYISIPLLKYLSQLCSDNPSTLSECPPLAISSLVTGLAIANYKPPNWNELQELVIKNFNRIEDDTTLSYLALRLVSLNCFNTKLLNYIFSIDQNIELMSYHYHQAIKYVYQIVKILHPTYTGPWPSQQLIDSFQTSETKKANINVLQPALEKILGGPSFIKTSVKTHFGHDINYLIVMQNGSPIAVQPKNSDSSTFVEDFIIPPNSNKIVILFLPSQAYGKNIPIMEASFSSKIKSLEALSFTVVSVSADLWSTMYDYEKLPYLRCLLKLPVFNDRDTLIPKKMRNL